MNTKEGQFSSIQMSIKRDKRQYEINCRIQFENLKSSIFSEKNYRGGYRKVKNQKVQRS